MESTGLLEFSAKELEEIGILKELSAECKKLKEEYKKSVEPYVQKVKEYKKTLLEDEKLGVIDLTKIVTQERKQLLLEKKEKAKMTYEKRKKEKETEDDQTKKKRYVSTKPKPFECFLRKKNEIQYQHWNSKRILDFVSKLNESELKTLKQYKKDKEKVADFCKDKVKEFSKKIVKKIEITTSKPRKTKEVTNVKIESFDQQDPQLKSVILNYMNTQDQLKKIESKTKPELLEKIKKLDIQQNKITNLMKQKKDFDSKQDVTKKTTLFKNVLCFDSEEDEKDEMLSELRFSLSVYRKGQLYWTALHSILMDSLSKIQTEPSTTISEYREQLKNSLLQGYKTYVESTSTKSLTSAVHLRKKKSKSEEQ